SFVCHHHNSILHRGVSGANGISVAQKLQLASKQVCEALPSYLREHSRNFYFEKSLALADILKKYFLTTNRVLAHAWVACSATQQALESEGANRHFPANPQVRLSHMRTGTQSNTSRYQLLAVEQDAKTSKGREFGYLTGILYLAPAMESGMGIDLC